MKRVLLVTSWSPMVCGIGKYAEQQAAAMRAQGTVVDVLSPREGEGDFREDLLGGTRILRLLKYAWAYDEVVVHFTSHFFYRSDSGADRLQTSLAFLAAMTAIGRKTTVVVHETEFNPDKPGEGSRRRSIDRWRWKLTRRVAFHSDRERQAFCKYYGIAQNAKLEVWPHHQFMTRYCETNREQARAALGLEQDKKLIVAIGFVQPHKGFDRMIEAFAQVPQARDLRLRIVGSVRIDWDEARNYAKRLHATAAADERVEFVEQHVDDATFDMWLIAADWVALPYRQIWSSGVGARAGLFDRPLLAADIGGLAEQLTPGSLLFKDDAGLVECLKRIQGTTR